MALFQAILTQSEHEIFFKALFWKKENLDAEKRSAY